MSILGSMGMGDVCTVRTKLRDVESRNDYSNISEVNNKYFAMGYYYITGVDDKREFSLKVMRNNPYYEEFLKNYKGESRNLPYDKFTALFTKFLRSLFNNKLHIVCDYISI